jgi:hypothetical protein
VFWWTHQLFIKQNESKNRPLIAFKAFFTRKNFSHCL